VLAEARDRRSSCRLETPADHPMAGCWRAAAIPISAGWSGSRRTTGGLARNISVDQVRSLGDLLRVTPSMSPWRAIVIDASTIWKRRRPMRC
jgi:DNA polymerase-3 subunit delta'